MFNEMLLATNLTYLFIIERYVDIAVAQEKIIAYYRRQFKKRRTALVNTATIITAAWEMMTTVDARPKNTHGCHPVSLGNW